MSKIYKILVEEEIFKEPIAANYRLSSPPPWTVKHDLTAKTNSSCLLPNEVYFWCRKDNKINEIRQSN